MKQVHLGLLLVAAGGESRGLDAQLRCFAK